MKRKHKVNEINLKIDKISPFVNERASGFDIEWSSDIGWGKYVIYKLNGIDRWVADSEYMDNNDDKDFITELMRLFIEELQIT